MESVAAVAAEVVAARTGAAAGVAGMEDKCFSLMVRGSANDVVGAAFEAAGEDDDCGGCDGDKCGITHVGIAAWDEGFDDDDDDDDDDDGDDNADDDDDDDNDDDDGDDGCT